MTLREAVAKVRGGAALPTLIIVIFVVHLPFLILHLASLWQQPHYQYFPVVIGAVCLLVYSRWTNVSDSRNASNSTSSPVFFTAISASLLLLLGAVYLVSPWLSAVSAVVFAGALAMQVRETRPIVNLLGIWCLLWLLISLPHSLDESLSAWCERVSAGLTSRVLDQLDCVHVINGNLLVLPGKTFSIAEVCGGLLSPLAMVAVAAIIAVWRNRPLLHSFLIIATGVFWAALLNGLRLVLMAVVHDRFQVDLSVGWPLLLMSAIVVITGLLLILSTDSLIVFLLNPMGNWAQRDHRARDENPLVHFWNGLVSFGRPSKAESTRSEPKEQPNQKVAGNLLWEQPTSSASRKSLTRSAFSSALAESTSPIQSSPSASPTLRVRTGPSAFAADPLAKKHLAPPKTAASLLQLSPSAFAADPLGPKEILEHLETIESTKSTGASELLDDGSRNAPEPSQPSTSLSTADSRLICPQSINDVEGRSSDGLDTLSLAPKWVGLYAAMFLVLGIAQLRVIVNENWNREKLPADQTSSRPVNVDGTYLLPPPGASANE